LKIARSVVERLATADIKGRYDHERDRLYVEIAPGPSAETSEMANGLKVDLDADGNVIGFRRICDRGEVGTAACSRKFSRKPPCVFSIPTQVTGIPTISVPVPHKREPHKGGSSAFLAKEPCGANHTAPHSVDRASAE
jgi:uncharacterized protein YuzE